MKKQRFIKVIGQTQRLIKVVGKTQRKLDPLKIAEALGASQMGKVNFPHYYTPSNMGKLRNLLKKHLIDSFETEMVKKVLGTIGAIWLNEINRPVRNERQRDQRLSFANLILPVLKPGMNNLVFMEAFRKYYGERKKKTKKR